MKNIQFVPFFLVLLLLCLTSGCIYKVPKACKTQRDCLQQGTQLFCINGICSHKACKLGQVKSCYDGPPGTAGKGLCRQGTSYCTIEGTWSKCLNQQLPQREICDKIDNNCSGTVDDVEDQKTCVCKTPGIRAQCYGGPSSTLGIAHCKAGIQYCEADNRWGRCVEQGLPGIELCDGLDNDCNGQIDDSERCRCTPDTQRPCYTGTLSTLNQGTCRAGLQRCSAQGFWEKQCVGEVRPQKKDHCSTRQDTNCDGKLDPACSTQCSAAGTTLCQNECVDLKTSKKHCGTCGNTCTKGASCDNGKCKQPCTFGMTLCGSQCVDTQYNKQHCGTCDQACTQGTQCNKGSCVCPDQQQLCASQCTHLQNDPKHCGKCNRVCAQGKVCSQGTCTSHCPAAQAKCGNQCCRPGMRCEQGTCICSTPGTQDCNGICRVLTAEICDGKDNDCNGNIDDLPSPGKPCYPNPITKPLQGECKQGKAKCVQGKEQCVGSIVPTTEVCNGKDDDCDGNVDEDTAGQPCYTAAQKQTLNVGECKAGISTCKQGKILCINEVKPSLEICDGKDNDCNGSIDDLTPSGTSCYPTPTPTPLKGECSKGTLQCVQGKMECVGSVLPTTEVCNGKDDDCDGSVDEGSHLHCNTLPTAHQPPYLMDTASITVGQTIQAVAIQPQGMSVASAQKTLSASTPAPIIIWHIQTRKILERLQIPINPTLTKKRIVSAMQWSRTGRYLAVATEDGKVFLWDLKAPPPPTSRTPIHNYTNPENNGVNKYSISALVFSKNEETLYIASGRKTSGRSKLGGIHIWNWRTQQTSSLLGHPGTRGTQAIALEQSERWLFSVGQGNKLKVWDLHKIQNPQQALASELSFPSEPLSLGLSPNNQDIAVGLSNQALLWLQWSPTGTKLSLRATRPGEPTITGHIFFTSSGNHILSIPTSPTIPGQLMRPIKMWKMVQKGSAYTIQLERTLLNLIRNSTSASYNGVWLLVGTTKASVHVYTQPKSCKKPSFDLELPQTHKKHTKPIRMLQVHRDGTHLLAVSSDGYTSIWNTTQPSIQFATTYTAQAGFSKVQFNPNIFKGPSNVPSLTYAVCLQSNAFFLLQMKGAFSTKFNTQILGTSPDCQSMTFHPYNGKVTLSVDHSLHTIEASTLTTSPGPIPGPTPGPHPLGPQTAQIAYSPSGEFFAQRVHTAPTIPLSNRIHIRSAPTASTVYQTLHINNMRHFAWSPDSTMFAIAKGRAIYIYPLQKGSAANVAYTSPLSGTEEVHHFEWSPDGRYIAIGYRTGKVRIWEYQTNTLEELTRSGTPHTDETYVTWSPDGKTLYTAGKGASVAAQSYAPKILRWKCP